MRCITLCLILLLYGCGSLRPDKITVIGAAWNAKQGAVVATDRETYTVDGVHAWDTIYYGKKVIVTGYLKRIEHRQQSTTDRQVQEMTGTELILVNPKFELAVIKTD